MFHADIVGMHMDRVRARFEPGSYQRRRRSESFFSSRRSLRRPRQVGPLDVAVLRREVPDVFQPFEKTIFQ